MKLYICSVDFQNLILVEVDRRRLMKLVMWSADFQNLILVEIGSFFVIECQLATFL
jgi:hypothetical protein